MFQGHLREAVIDTCDLGQNRRDFCIECEFVLLHEIPSDAPKIDRRKKIFQIHVEDISPMAMLARSTPRFEPRGLF